EGATSSQLVGLNQRGLASGLTIEQLNAERARLSAIKGGKLAARLGSRVAYALFISDVPGDDPAVIGSGLLGPAPRGDRIERLVVASVEHAMAGARSCAESFGLSVWTDTRRFDGEAERLG